jgi:prophage DNA circulation protein
MASWDDILQVGKFDGVEFDFVSTKDEHSNELDQQKFPNKPGTFIAPRSRNGIRFSVLAIFIEDDYPDKMDELIEKLDNGGAPKEFVHPVFGSFKAACERFTVTHDIEDCADSATLEISFAEHTEDGSGTKAIRATTPARANAVRSAAAEVLTALSAFQEATEAPNNNAYVLQVTGAINAAESIAESLEATGDEISSLEVQAQTNAALAVIEEAVDAGADYDSTEAYDLGQSVLVMSSAVSTMANELIDAKPPLQERAVVADTNLLALAHDFYGDSTRADELLTLNSFPDPSLIPAGFKVLAYGV